MANGHALTTNQNANSLGLSNGNAAMSRGKLKNWLLETGKHIIHPKKWKIARRHRAERKAKEIIETALHNAAAHQKLKVKEICPPDFLYNPKAAQKRQKKAEEKAGIKCGLAQVALCVNVKFGAAPVNVFMGLNHIAMSKEIASEINSYLKSHNSHYHVDEKDGITLGNDTVNKVETMKMTIELKKC